MNQWLALSIVLIAALFGKTDCKRKLSLCKKSSRTIGEDNLLEKTIIFEKSFPSISNIFSYATIYISAANSQFQVKITNDSSYFSALMTSQVQSVYIRDKLSCFEDFRVDLELLKPSSILIKVLEKKFDFTSFVLFIMGCTLFVNAKYLSRNTPFMYASCASVGVLTSCLVFLFILYRFMPYKRVMGFLIAVGSGMWFYFLNQIQSMIGSILMNHPYHVVAYLSISALAAISLLYYFGIPSNEKSLNLFQWFMQLSAICIIFSNCYNKTFPVTIIVILIIFQIFDFPKTVAFVFKSILPRKVMAWLWPPPKHRFLTSEEYEQQTREATEKGLKELQEFCSSPKCNSWEMVSRLKDPKRFATYLRSGDQFTNDEVNAYYIESESELTEDSEHCSRDNSLNVVGNRCVNEQRTTDWMSEDEKTENSGLLSD